MKSAFLAAAIASVGAAFCLLPSVSAAQTAPAASSTPGLPAGLVWQGPTGWASDTRGGKGGRIIKVTTLAGEGPGSLREAIEAEGPRIIVFEVGGVIDLGRRTLVISNPYVTIAGQTAPSPGVTLIRGGMDIKGHDVIVQHLRIRPGDNGEPRGSGFAEDSISTQGAYNVIVDHCSLTWGVDENLSASGPRFTGKTPDEWRKGASHNIAYTYNLIAEGLSDSTHPKFEHSKGSLIHDNGSNILIYGNIYAHNYERNPLFKGGVRGAVINNLIYNPGPRAVHYNLQALEWAGQAFETGRLTLMGNVMRGGPSTPAGTPLVMLGGDGDLQMHARDNIAVDKFGAPLPMTGRYTTGPAKIINAPRPLDLPPGLAIQPAVGLERTLLANAGARPWDRDMHDVRVLADVAEGRGEIIDSQSEVGGYPVEKMTQRPFDPAKWDLATMAPLTADALDSGLKARGT